MQKPCEFDTKYSVLIVAALISINSYRKGAAVAKVCINYNYNPTVDICTECIESEHLDRVDIVTSGYNETLCKLDADHIIPKLQPFTH